MPWEESDPTQTPQKQEPQQDHTGQPTKRDGKMSKQEAQRLLQAIRDREQQRRKERLEQDATGQPTTGRDY